jgi:hypothetical protein
MFSIGDGLGAGMINWEHRDQFEYADMESIEVEDG